MPVSGRDFELLVEPCAVQLSGAIGSARNHATTRAWLNVRVETEFGVGTGQACPLPGYTADHLELARGCLQGFPLERLPALGELAREPEAAKAVFSALAELGPIASPSARYALETALLDLLARARGAPLHRLFTRAPAKPLPLSALLPVGDGESTKNAAQALVRAGFRHLKVKLGGVVGWQRELQELRTLRSGLPEGVRLRADVNGLWGTPEASYALRELAQLDLEFVEEPVAFSSLAALPVSSVALALDESLQSPETSAQLPALAGRGDIRFLILKPTALGGFARCLELARLARALGLRVVVTHCFDAPIAHAAACELALALGEQTACGLASHPVLIAARLGAAEGPEQDARSRVPQLAGAWLLPQRGAGHGLNPGQL